MKNILKILFLTGLITSSSISAQKVTYPYEIGLWQGFKQAAVSYTFDDDCNGQLQVAVPLFDKYGFKVTLFTVTNCYPDWKGLQAAANNGHEIASHTVNHPSLDSISYARQTMEYRDSKDTIEYRIKGQKCVTIAYPYCSCGDSTLCSEFYIAARSCDGFMEPSTPPNFMCISSVGCGQDGQVKTAQEFNAKIESALPTNSWCVFMMHGIDNDKGYSPLSSNELATHLKYVDANKSKYWVSTFGNVTRYIKERNAASLTVLRESLKKIKLQFSDSLENSIYNFPLTIRRPLPKGWKGARVQQGAVKLPIQFVRMNLTHYIQFDAIPNGGIITINKQKKLSPPS